MPSDPIFRAVLLLLGLDVILGAVLMVLAHYGVVGAALGDVGAVLGIVGGVLYLFFRWWGRRREAAARVEPAARADEGRDPPR